MPQLGLDMKEGTVERWLKKEGEPVTRGEIIVEIETEKATVQVEATSSGVLGKILTPEGEKVPVGHVIAIIAAPDEDISALEVAAAPPAAEVEAAAPAPTAAAPAPAEVGREERVRASPRARRLAEEHGIDLSLIKGSGPQGRIVDRDVEAYLAQRAAAPAAPPAAAKAPTPAAPSPMRQAIARRMAQSKREIPHFYVSMTADMTEAQRFRRQFNEALEGEEKVSVNDLVVRACAKALLRFPQFNAWYLEDQLQVKEQINIGIAIALEDGLIAPAILDCANKDLRQLAAASADLVRRARSGTLKADEYTAPTFTISNLGMYDVDTFIAIINPPQVAILALGAVRQQPVTRDGSLATAELMNMTLSADHRALDGASAAAFLAEVKALLEAPWKLL